jgi:heptose I phosphotransferase
MIHLPVSWQRQWQGEDLFEQILSIDGEEYRNMDGRRTLRFEMLGKSYFAKLYRGIGWKRIFKSLFLFRKPPVLTAQNEWLAIQELTKLGIDTMTIVGYGIRGISPATKQSFLITEELQRTESLEDFCRDWPNQPPDPELKWALIKKIAHNSRIMHANGINHRDYYLCHFLLDISRGKDNLDSTQLVFYLIDLHRVQLRGKVPQRWKVKDLASLYFSAMEIGLTQRDKYRFIREYTGQSLCKELSTNSQLWRQVENRAKSLLDRFDRKYRS